MALTIGQIHAAANAIDKQGNKPTLASVRAILGGGSFTTISEAMKTWKKENDEEKIEASEIPEEVEESAAKLVAKIWETATQQAGKAHDKDREEYKLELEKQTKIYLELMIDADKIADENSELIVQLLTKQEEIEKKTNLIDEQREHILQLDADLNAERKISKERLNTIKAISTEIKTPNKKQENKTKKKTPVNGELVLDV